MNKLIYIILLMLINVNIVQSADIVVSDVSKSELMQQKYKVRGANGDEVEISQNLVNISSWLQSAVKWMVRDKKFFVDISETGIDINVLRLFDNIINNNLSAEEVELIEIHVDILLDYVDPLLIDFNKLPDVLINLLFKLFLKLNFRQQIAYYELLPSDFRNHFLRRYLLENYQDYLFKNGYLDYIVKKD